MKTFTPKRRSDKHFALFKNWVVTSISIEDLKRFKGVKGCYHTTLRKFHRYLDKPPFPNKTPRQDRPPIYLKIDGTYFGHWGCLLVYKSHTGKFIYWNFVTRENFFNYRYDLEIIKGRYKILGITSDWHGSLVSAVKHTLPDIPHQRCLVHTERTIKQKLTLKPKTEAGKDLLVLARKLNNLESYSRSRKWIYRLHAWYYKYELFLKEKSYGINPKTGKDSWWYTHKRHRSAYKTLYSTLDNLFLHFDYELLDKDTNGLEVEFKHLNHKINKHIGLTRRRKVSLMFWYLYLKNKERN